MPTPCICIFSALFHPSMGGVETYTENLARTLAKSGYRIIVVTLATHGPSGTTVHDDVEVVRLPCRGYLGNRYPVALKNSEHRALWSQLESERIDYVVVNTRFYLHSLEGLAFARAKSVAPVLIEHGSAHLTMGNPFVDAGVGLVEHALTRAERRYGASHYGVSRKSSAWLSHFGIESQGELPNAISADAYADHASTRDFRREFDLPANSFTVAFIGRLVREKGILELAQAVAEWASAQDITLLVAGDGPLGKALRAHESARIRLLGKLCAEDVAALLTQVNALCLPSRSEGFATALLEAAACGTPAIVTDVGGVDELIPNGSFGTVIPDRQPETIRKALELAAENPRLLHAQGRHAGERVRTEHTWEKTAERVIEACRNAQGQGDPKREA